MYYGGDYYGYDYDQGLGSLFQGIATAFAVGQFLSICIIILIIVGLILLAMEFNNLAIWKGYGKEGTLTRYFWYCLLFNIGGYLLVGALPNLNDKADKNDADEDDDDNDDGVNIDDDNEHLTLTEKAALSVSLGKHVSDAQRSPSAKPTAFLPMAISANPPNLSVKGGREGRRRGIDTIHITHSQRKRRI